MQPCNTISFLHIALVRLLLQVQPNATFVIHRPLGADRVEPRQSSCQPSARSSSRRSAWGPLTESVREAARGKDTSLDGIVISCVCTEASVLDGGGVTARQALAISEAGLLEQACQHFILLQVG